MVTTIGHSSGIKFPPTKKQFENKFSISGGVGAFLFNDNKFKNDICLDSVSCKVYDNTEIINRPSFLLSVNYTWHVYKKIYIEGGLYLSDFRYKSTYEADSGFIDPASGGKSRISYSDNFRIQPSIFLKYITKSFIASVGCKTQLYEYSKTKIIIRDGSSSTFSEKNFEIKLDPAIMIEYSGKNFHNLSIFFQLEYTKKYYFLSTLGINLKLSQR